MWTQILRYSLTSILFLGFQSPETQPSTKTEAIYSENFENAQESFKNWKMRGKIKAELTPIPEKDAQEKSLPNGVSGKALRIEGEAQSGLQSPELKKKPRFADAEALVLRMNAENATKESPTVIEIQAYCEGRKAFWWRKISIEKTGWQEFSLPLRYFRWSDNAAPSWEEVDRIGFWFRSKTSVWIDGIELLPGNTTKSAYISVPELQKIAFQESQSSQVFEKAPFSLLTNSKELKHEAVLESLLNMYQQVRKDFPSLPQASRSVPLIIFSKEDNYRNFWPSLAERFNAKMNSPKSDGFTALGVASAFFSDKTGPVRPVYVHEANHALMHQLLGLSGEGDWLSEALATRYQLAFSKQDIRPTIQEAILKDNYRSSFENLLNGEKIPLNRYWQAYTILEWLNEDATKQKTFAKLLNEMRSRASTDLRPLAKEYFGMALEGMEKAWLEWLKAKYQ